MSEQKLMKFLSRDRSPQRQRKIATPVVLADSKGNYLRHEVLHEHETNIVWWNKPGARVEERLHWLEQNIDAKLEQHGPIWLYIWLGTCNLTSKNKQYISLHPQIESELENIQSCFQRFLTIIQSKPGCRVTFLETPIYSIEVWNRTKHHKSPETFVDQDHLLKEKVYALNGIVRELNTSVGSHSPQFTCDLSRNPKVKTGGQRKAKSKPSHNFSLMKDGIHPGKILSRVWLRKIAEQAKRDCWHD